MTTSSRIQEVTRRGTSPPRSYRSNLRYQRRGILGTWKANAPLSPAPTSRKGKALHAPGWPALWVGIRTKESL